MEPAEIEVMVSERIHAAIEAAAAQCIRELNNSGHAFSVDEEAIFSWIDATSGQALSIDCALGVGVSRHAKPAPRRDAQVDEYLALAESGSDAVASVLNQLEGDIANGGFLQLLDNKGTGFMREALEYLQRIGASETAATVQNALEIVAKHTSLRTAYRDFERQLERLDARFFAPGESIPALYLRHKRRHEA